MNESISAGLPVSGSVRKSTTRTKPVCFNRRQTVLPRFAGVDSGSAGSPSHYPAVLPAPPAGIPASPERHPIILPFCRLRRRGFRLRRSAIPLSCRSAGFAGGDSGFAGAPSHYPAVLPASPAGVGDAKGGRALEQTKKLVFCRLRQPYAPFGPLSF